MYLNLTKKTFQYNIGHVAQMTPSLLMVNVSRLRNTQYISNHTEIGVNFHQKLAYCHLHTVRGYRWQLYLYFVYKIQNSA